MGQFVRGKYDSTPTETQLRRVQKDWEDIAGESIQIEYIKGSIIGLCSELGVLRLEHKYKVSKARAGYSQNLGSWYFELELKY
jgi:hypothetical protein